MQTTEATETQAEIEIPGYNCALRADWEKSHGTNCYDTARKAEEAEKEYWGKGYYPKLTCGKWPYIVFVVLTLGSLAAVGSMRYMIYGRSPLTWIPFTVICMVPILSLILGLKIMLRWLNNAEEFRDEKMHTVKVAFDANKEASKAAVQFVADLATLRKVMGAKSDDWTIEELKGNALRYMVREAEGAEDMWQKTPESFMPDGKGPQVLQSFIDHCDAFCRLELIDRQWRAVLNIARNNLAGRQSSTFSEDC